MFKASSIRWLVVGATCFAASCVAQTPGAQAPGAQRAGAQDPGARPAKPSAAIPAFGPQSALPATPITTVPIAAPATPDNSTEVAHRSRAATRTDVSYRQGQLEIVASNSSLNEILRQVSRQTGMKITGGVVDEPVYGTYGPGAPGEILSTLLDGTGSNVLLVQGTGAAPVELILTPRQGGATPPNPNAGGFENGANNEDGPQRVRRTEQLTAAPQFAPRPINPDGALSTEPASEAGAPAAAAAPAPIGPSDPANSPNAIKTPQQIYDQLLRLRQQQQNPPR